MAYDGSLKFDTKVDDKGFKKGINRLKTIGTKTLDVVKKSAVASAAAITGIGAASIKMGSDFESAMARVGALSGATGKDFKKLEKTAMELGKTTVFSASEAAEGMQYLAMAGYKTNDIVSAMPGLLNAAAAGQTDLGVAADITSNILSGFGLEAKETTKVADVLTLAFTSSNTSLESLGETMKYAAPVARAAGFSLEETAAAAGILGDAGIQGSMAGTALRGVMLRLVNPPKQAAEALDALGVSVVDSSGKIKPLYQIVEELEKATEGMTEAQKTAIISQIAGQNAASGLLAIMDAGPETLKAFTQELENAGGTAEEVANRQLDNLQGDLKLLGSVLETTGINIYNNLQEPLRGATQTLTGYVEQLADATSEQKGFSEMAGIMGDILADMVTKVAEFVPKMLKAATEMMSAFIMGIKDNKEQLVQAALDILQSFIQAFLDIVPEMIVLGIQMLTSFIQGFVQMLPELIVQAQDAIFTIVDAIAENLPLILEAGIQIIVMLAQGIAEMLPELITQFIDLVIMLADVVIENLPLIMEAGLQIIIALIQGIIENLPTLIEHVPRIINAFFDTIIENLPMVLQAGWEIIKMLVVGIIEAIPVIIKNLPAIIRAIVNVITMYNWAQLGKNIMVWLKDGIMKMPGKIAQAGKHIAKAGWDAIKNIFADAPRLGKGFIKWLIDGILGMLGNLVSSAGSLAKSAFSAIKGIFSGAPGLGKDFVKWLGNGIKSMFSNLASIAKDLGSGAIKAVKGIFKGMPNIGKYFVQGIWSGIASLTGWIGSKIAGFAKNLVKSFKNFFKISSPSKIMKDEIGENLTLGIGVGIEEGMPELQKDAEKELAALTEKMKATVNFESSNIGTKISAGSDLHRAAASSVVSSTETEKDKDGVVHATFVVDGREVAKATAPYSSNEMELARKRRTEYAY